MRKVLSVAGKELLLYFKSPAAYIILILTMSVFNIFFFMIIDQGREASLKDVFQVMEFLFVFFVPLLTMRLFAEERSTGTMELLMTSPLTNTAIVLGKYLGALVLFSTIIGMTLVYYGIIEYFGHPDPATIFMGYAGIWLEGAFFLAVGMMVSSWTSSQTVAAITAYAGLFTVYFSISFMKYFSGSMEVFVRQMGTWSHLENFASGLVTTGDVVYYLSGILVCIVLTRLSLENRTGLSRWKLAAFRLVVIVCLAALFVGVNYFSIRSAWRWDVTQAKQHTLTKGTIGLLKSLGQEVQFSALYAGIAPVYLENLFKEYARASEGRIKTEIIDPVEQIGYAAQFGNVINEKQNKVIVRSGKERRDVDFTDEPLSEEQLTNAVMRVTREERRACFLTGHGEYSLVDKGDQGLTILSNLMAANNVSSREVMLGIEGDVPEDCSVLVVAGPHTELTDKEERVIEQYLRRGGDALFLIENTVVTTLDKRLTDEELHRNPALNNILNQWGVHVEEDVVVDLASHAGDDVGSPATRNYAKHKALTEGLDYTFYVRPRSMRMLREKRPTIKLAPIVMTASGEKSWAETNRTLKVAFDPLEDAQGPVPLAFVVLDEQQEGMSSNTRMIVFTDADFLTNIYINQYSNSRMGLNIINWLSESEPGVFIDARKIKVERLDLTSKQKRQVAVVLFLMPLVIALAGLLVWLKRIC